MTMRASVLATVLALSTAPAAAAPNLNIEVFDNGALVASASSVSGSAGINVTSDPNFSLININASGAPIDPLADLTSVTLDVTSAAISSPHQLEIDVFQTGVGISLNALTASTFTVNDLIGSAGIGTVENTYFNGTSSTLGTLLATWTFPVGTVDASEGPFDVLLPGGLSADAEQYLISFGAPGETANDTINLVAVPELTTWAMFALGFVLLALRRKRPFIPRSAC
jgi:hypothetical protein